MKENLQITSLPAPFHNHDSSHVIPVPKVARKFCICVHCLQRVDQVPELVYELKVNGEFSGESCRKSPNEWTDCKLVGKLETVNDIENRGKKPL